MSSSCSDRCHSPIYIAVTFALIIAAISTSSSLLLHDERDGGDLILNLHRSGFHLTAQTLHLSSFLPSLSSSPFTLFALPDSALSALSLPAADHVLRSYTSPLPLPLSSLPRGTPIAVPTLIPDKNLTLITAAAFTVNGVPITHPDLFGAAGGPHVAHGVAAPFPASYEPKIAVRWGRVVRALASRGYASFSVGLSSVLDSLPPMMDQVTVFAPRDDGRTGTGFDYVAAPADVLERACRRHVAVGRLGLGEMEGVKEMRTLDEDWGLRITGRGWGRVEVNGVEIVEPDVYVDDGVVVHGVAVAFPC